MTTLEENHKERIQKNADQARAMLSDWTSRAAQIVMELAETAENDRVRLSAANSILDRAGVVAPTETKVTVSPEEHALIRADAEEAIQRLRRNQAAAALAQPTPSLEAIVIHEGVVEDEPASEGAS